MIKNKKKIVITSLVILEIISLFLVYKSFPKNKTILDEVKLQESATKNDGFAIMLEQSDGTYIESKSNKWPTDMMFNARLSGCMDANGNKIDNALSYNDITNSVKLRVSGAAYCYVYFDNGNNIYNQVVTDAKNNNGAVLLSDDEKGNRTYDTYYYKGDITNNNVLYGGFCWKMVMTTEGNGVKMIYNGDPRTKDLTFEKLIQNEYNVVTNAPSEYPFEYDSSTNEWTSSAECDSCDGITSTFEFKVSNDGDYKLSYLNITADSSMTELTIYKNESILVQTSTEEEDEFSLNLTKEDVIKVIFHTYGETWSYHYFAKISLSKYIYAENTTISCDNLVQHIGYSDFNTSMNSIASAGYMYNKVYDIGYKSDDELNEDYKYGNSYTYSNGSYKLSNAIIVSDYGTEYKNIENNRYTCFNETGTCSSIYYIESFWKYSLQYMTLTEGKSAEDALNEMLYADDVNKISSTIKKHIDNWYENNLLNKKDSEGNLYSDYLQNTIYCNNREMTSNYEFNYGSLDCANQNDQFTLKVEKGGTKGYGNNALDYPIGLLTYKEADLIVEYDAASYLLSNDYYYLLSPFEYSTPEVWHHYVYDNGNIGNEFASTEQQVRPVLALNKNVKIASGDGSYDNPYQVKLK